MVNLKLFPFYLDLLTTWWSPSFHKGWNLTLRWLYLIVLRSVFYMPSCLPSAAVYILQIYVVKYTDDRGDIGDNNNNSILDILGRGLPPADHNITTKLVKINFFFFLNGITRTKKSILFLMILTLKRPTGLILIPFQ